MLNNDLFVILYQSMDLENGGFPPVVVSLPVWDLEVNTANEVRCFSMTHANVLVKFVHVAILHSSSLRCEILVSSLQLCSCTQALVHSQMWSVSNITCSVPGRLMRSMNMWHSLFTYCEKEIGFRPTPNWKKWLKGQLMWTCCIMKTVTDSINFFLVIWLTPKSLEKIY